MKYILTLGAVLFCIGCTYSDPEFDKNMKQLNDTIAKNAQQLRVLNCDTGISFTIEEFLPLLKNKVHKGQLDKLWAKCEGLK